MKICHFSENANTCERIYYIILIQPLKSQILSMSISYLILKIEFNVNFLIEALSVMDGERVHVELSGETSPCLMTDLQDTGAKFVVSPMII